MWKRASILLLTAAIAIYKSCLKRKSNAINTSFSSSTSIDQYHLPEEVIELIISKCDDIKSVTRFKSVSKSWQSIISNPRFSRTLRSKRPANQNKFFAKGELGPPDGCDEYLYLISFEKDGEFRRERVLGYPFRKSRTVLLCSCDGLILFRCIHEGLMLWNPLIGKHINIPCSFNSISHPRAFRKSMPKNHHLYHDSSTDDHKIVFVYEDIYVVYSCENKTWGEERDLPHGQDGRFFRACIDGIIYGLQDYKEIICLDTRDGKLHKLELPNDVRGGKRFELTAVSGRLCLYINVVQGELLQLWVMEENRSFMKRWRKVLDMENAMPYRYIWMLTPAWLSNEYDVVFWGIYRGGERRSATKFFIYNPRKNKNSRFREIDWKYSTVCFPYSESLYLPSSNVC